MRFWICLTLLWIPAVSAAGETRDLTIDENSGRVRLSAKANDSTMVEIPADTRTLFMLSAQNVTPEGFTQLTRLHELRFLRLNKTAHGDDVLKALAEHPTLTKLMMWTDTGITADGIHQLSSVTPLRSLEFSGVELDEAALRALPTQLEQLAMSHLNMGDAKLAALPTFPQLKRIQIKNAQQLSDVDLIAFVQRHPHLEEISVDVTSERFLAALRKLPNLKSLWLGGQPITANGWRTIGQLDGLERLWVSSDLSDEMRVRIKQLPNPKLEHVGHLGKYIYLDRRSASP